MDHYELDGFMDMYNDSYGRKREAQPTDRNDDPQGLRYQGYR